MRAEPRYRAVVIGCGRVGSRWTADARESGVHSHAQAYREHPRTELVGLADIDPQRLTEAARLWGVPTHSDPLALCRRMRPDLVSLCTPDATHHPLAEALLLQAPPRLLFVEKPLACREQDGERLLELAARAGCTLAVNYSRRFSPAFRALRDELRDGRHGTPLLARFIYGKGLLHNGTHAIDLLRLWLGDPLKAVGRPAAWGPDGDETYDADLWFSSGCRARLEAFDERVATVFELDLLTDRSRWRFWAGGSQWEFAEAADDPSHAGYRAYRPTHRERTDPLFASPLAACLTHAVDDLVSHLDRSTALLCSAEDAIAALRWAERIRQAA